MHNYLRKGENFLESHCYHKSQQIHPSPRKHCVFLWLHVLQTFVHGQEISACSKLLIAKIVGRQGDGKADQLKADFAVQATGVCFGSV